MQKGRLLIGGTHSGCGKTTLACALMRAFSQQYSVAAFKCGPDYIDPMFHDRALNIRSRNLDAYLCSGDTVKLLLDTPEADIAIIEGVMGFYDGVGMKTDFASSNYISMLTGTPAVLVVNCSGMGLSIAALVKGYADFLDNRLKGVILDNCSMAQYRNSKAAIENSTPLKVYGFMPRIEQASIKNRYMGLVKANEIEGLAAKLDALANAAIQDIDMDGLYALSLTADKLTYSAPEVEKVADVNIAVAQDQAFCFYYQDGLDLLERMGARIIPFSPMLDERLPKEADGLYIGGGYPELYAEELEGNGSMRKYIREAIENKMPTIAECGGMMYLHERMQGANGKYYGMAGVIHGDTYMTGKSTRFGYAELTAKKDNMLCRAGERIRAHEYHYSDSTQTGADITVRKPNGREWECGYTTDTLFALYPHIHLWGNIGFARRFVEACAGYTK